MAKRKMNLKTIAAAIQSPRTPENLKRGLIKKYGHLLKSNPVSPLIKDAISTAAGVLTAGAITEGASIFKKHSKKYAKKFFGKNPGKKTPELKTYKIRMRDGSFYSFAIKAKTPGEAIRRFNDQLPPPMQDFSAEAIEIVSKKNPQIHGGLVTKIDQLLQEGYSEKYIKDKLKLFHGYTARAAQELIDFARQKTTLKKNPLSSSFYYVAVISKRDKTVRLIRTSKVLNQKESEVYKTEFQKLIGPFKTSNAAWTWAHENGYKARYSNPCKSNPPRKDMVEIYDEVLAIEAVKGGSSLWPKEKFRHNFKKNKGQAKIYGLKDGSILIKGKKKLWKKFDYSKRDI